MAQENVAAVAENGKGNGAVAKLPTFSILKPHLIVEAPHAADAISFYKRVFGAEEIAKSHHPKRKADQELPLILHAHLKFGAAEVMVCDETEEAGAEYAFSSLLVFSLISSHFLFSYSAVNISI